MEKSISEIFLPYEAILSGSRTKYAYGTAGFRSRYTQDMHPLFLTVGMLAAFRSISLGGKCVGVMITASHNDEPDNGVKIVDVDGGMLIHEWELLAEKWVNLPLPALIADIEAQIESFSRSHPGITPLVMVGMDTRPHSPILLDFVTQGISAIGSGISLNLGEVITPVLHFSVLAYNEGSVTNTPAEFMRENFLNYYYETQYQGYRQLLDTKTTPSASSGPRKLILDLAYGVGSVTVGEFLAHVSSRSCSMGVWEIETRNRAHEGVVNHNCGAEHAQKLQLPPQNLSNETDAGHLLSSFDGDGDRIVFHYFSSTGKWILLDGDRIACLFSEFIYRSLVEADLLSKVKMGVVQTAYANGSSSQYLSGFSIPVVLAKTGVKYLHHKAKHLDVGVYFEANGHGTVLFSDHFRSVLASSIEESNDASVNTSLQKQLALRRLQAIASLINPAVGDALSDLLCTLAILEVDNMDPSRWNDMFTELPSKQVKVAVKNKSLLICSDDETHLLEPALLQTEINRCVADVCPSRGRCFVRPSGTEDVVRIYVEATTDSEVDKIVASVREALITFCS